MWAQLLLRGDVIIHPFDDSTKPESVVVMFVRFNRTMNRYTIGCGNAAGLLSTFFFNAHDVVRVVKRAEVTV